ncbi:MAG: hypothetical protein HYZ40_15675 [Rhodospirillales bacterium]|nr:hypothetical protein [Rhodospirillales bacterium]
MIQPVVLAGVPCVHLESASSVPGLSASVFFGSSHEAVTPLPIGVPVFIYASIPPHPLFKPGQYSWTGTLGSVVRAVESGPRAGKCPDPSRRPPTAEGKDGPALYFWEVQGLHQLATPRPLADFKSKTSINEVPRWPVVAELDI